MVEYECLDCNEIGATCFDYTPNGGLKCKRCGSTYVLTTYVEKEVEIDYSIDFDQAGDFSEVEF